MQVTRSPKYSTSYSKQLQSLVINKPVKVCKRPIVNLLSTHCQPIASQLSTPRVKFDLLLHWVFKMAAPVPPPGGGAGGAGGGGGPPLPPPAPPIPGPVGPAGPAGPPGPLVQEAPHPHHLE